MSWYHMPTVTVMLLFVVLLVAAVLQMLAALQAGELLLERRALCVIRLHSGMMSVISGVLSLEALLAVASIEGGIFLPIPSGLRYIAALPAAGFLAALLWPARLPAPLRPFGVSCFVPLLLLPPLGRLPWPLPLLTVAFVAFWLLADAARLLCVIREYARREITREAVAHVIRRIEHGVCVADRRGRILEANPAFYRLCQCLGIQAFERTDELETALDRLRDAGQLDIVALENGRSIRTGSGVFIYRQCCYKSGRITYMELSLSDVTEIAHAATVLERENDSLEQENRRLERVIADIGLEAAARERDKLSRAVHDLWSQRLAVAGLTLDILLDEKDRGKSGGNPEELRGLLEAPTEADTAVTACELCEVLESLSAMYLKLGVKISACGKADFGAREQEALCAVLKEAFANAVRHAYARHIDLLIFEDAEKRGVIIRNGCLDEEQLVSEGRGLYDMETRVRRAGGSVTYTKGDTFELRAAFPREPANAGEAVL